MTSLTESQKKIMREFYAIPPTRVIFNKNERKVLWDSIIKHKNIDLSKIKKACPAIVSQIERSYKTGNNIQSAVFSECVYAQTLANMFNLNIFINCYEDTHFISESIITLLHQKGLVARYAYFAPDKSRLLIEAGGHGGVDSALITVLDKNIYTIEFKEPYSKTSESDLPPYNESGKFLITDDFVKSYPQFKMMIQEQKELNFFSNIGHNINNFSSKSIQYAVNKNYVGDKFADVICTEDKNSYLTMMPCDQVSLWARLQGEIRTSGRNSFYVWTPIALKHFLLDMGGVIKDSIVYIAQNKLQLRKGRGSGGKVSGYKINPLFFVRKEDCIVDSGVISFNLENVRQLKPTIAAKMDFKRLEYKRVKEYYI